MPIASGIPALEALARQVLVAVYQLALGVVSLLVLVAVCLPDPEAVYQQGREVACLPAPAVGFQQVLVAVCLPAPEAGFRMPQEIIGGA